MRKRRRSGPDSGAGPEAGTGPAGNATVEDEAEVAAGSPRRDGPWDEAERPVGDDDEGRLHLGSLSVAGHAEVEVRLQVDEASGQVGSVMLVAGDGALELRAFAAPRHEDIWEEIRPRIAAEATRMGGTATDADGPFGRALQLLVPATAPDGQLVTQPSLVLGIAGPRWLLRVSAFGRPAVDYQQDGLLETVLRDVVVIRGTQPMAPGDPLPLRLPGNARQLPPPS